jgi:uncharacterized protein (DUF1697 family)
VRQLVLLRGVNVGGRNRVAMAPLREALEQAGMEDVLTYLQSGNVLLSSDDPPDLLAGKCKAAVAERFGLEIAVVVRTLEQLAGIVRHDPLGDIADQPKLYQVSFCAAEPSNEAIERILGRAVEGERVLAHGSEIYAWLPHGSGRSAVASALAAPSLGVVATARNWTTITNLLALAER